MSSNNFGLRVSGLFVAKSLYEKSNGFFVEYGIISLGTDAISVFGAPDGFWDALTIGSPVSFLVRTSCFKGRVSYFFVSE